MLEHLHAQKAKARDTGLNADFYELHFISAEKYSSPLSRRED